MSSGNPPNVQMVAELKEHPPRQGQPRTRPIDQRVGQIADLLQSLDDAAAECGLSDAKPPSEHATRLVTARLGVASSLFTALRCRHAPTADHCLRVAVGCSAWATALAVPPAYREAIEMAALLHDIGKIGVPDSILFKPGKLSDEEVTIMARHRRMSLDILSSCTPAPAALEIIRYSTTWYDGSKAPGNRDLAGPGSELEVAGEDIPFGARMLAIVDAFDAMVTDHIYRPARSRERAMAELFACAGTQFDPKLVENFTQVFAADSAELSKAVIATWLEAIAGQQQEVPWGFCPPSRLADDGDDRSQLFAAKLIDNMHDGVAFVDRERRLFAWNTGAERTTGLAAGAVQGNVWLPDLFDMRSELGKRILEEDCPVAQAIQSGVPSLKRVIVAGRHEKEVPLDLQVIPVRGSDGSMLGATVLLKDASGEASLEERCQALQDLAARDPLTQLANRAEFDRMHGPFIEAHFESGLPCSLIIADIDHFKYVNDVYGHLAGDQALKTFADLLLGVSRAGDFVARYGGEEFVILCADCNNAAAAARAEQIRRRLADMPQLELASRCITASFGVTELQGGDTPETMLRRADRALLQAKDLGRNQVVQLGGGMVEEERKKPWWPFRSRRNQSVLDVDLVTVVPISIAAQKLRGFIADHSAKITSTGADHLFMEISGEKAGSFRREGDRPVPFLIELRFTEERTERDDTLGFAKGDHLQTRVHVVIRPKKERSGGREQVTVRARQILVSLKSYLMAKEAGGADGPTESTNGVGVRAPQVAGRR